MKNNNGNSHKKEAFNIDGKEVEFPVSYQLKAVMTGTENDDDNKEKLVAIFDKLEIPYQYHDKKVSSKGSYTSYTYKVTVNSRQQMDALYAELKNVKELKFAV